MKTTQDKEEVLLATAGRQQIAERWPDSRVIAELDNEKGGKEWLVETDKKNLIFVAKKSQSGLFKRSKIPLRWTVETSPDSVLQAILKTLRANKTLNFVAYTARRAFDKKDKKKHTHTHVSLAKTETPLSWQDVFPDDPLPESAQWVVAKQNASIKGSDLVVEHLLKQGKHSQINEYRLPLKQISYAVVESTLAFKTFPFNIPHTHKITEGGKVTYDRPLADWDAHAEQKGLVEDSNVKEKSCQACKIKFFDTSQQKLCYACMKKTHNKTLGQAKQLIHEARSLATDDNWKETSEKFKDLQARWQRLEAMPTEASEELWQEFRRYSQKFFDRQSQHFDSVNEQRQKNVKAAKSLISKAKKLQKSTDKRTAREGIIELQKQWKSVNPLPREQADTLWQEFNSLCQSFFDKEK